MNVDVEHVGIDVHQSVTLSHKIENKDEVLIIKKNGDLGYLKKMC